MLNWVFEESFKGVSRMFQVSLKGVSRKIQGVIKGDSKELQRYLKQVQFKVCYKEVSRQL